MGERLSFDAIADRLEIQAFNHIFNAISDEPWAKNLGRHAEIAAAYIKLAEFVRSRATSSHPHGSGEG